MSSNNADMAELVDALDLGSSAARRGGSTPSIRTTNPPVKANDAAIARESGDTGGKK
jgi:hypothetical protein